MSIKIDRASIQKLGHETQEIRLRTLEQIENKVARALTHNERIDFRPGELIKYLIRWFAFQPLQAKDIVLNLIMRILKSPYRQEVIDYLGEERLKKELGRVKILVKSTPEVQLVVEILTMLENNHHVSEVIEISDSLSISDSYDSLSIRGNDLDSDSQVNENGNEMGYEIAWSRASIPDYNSLKVISDILKTNNSASDLHNALEHIQITIDDYPAEYFLQPPHIFQNLLDLFESSSSAFEDLSETFICICKSLLGRLRTRRKAVAFFSSSSSSKPVIPVKTQMRMSTVCFRLLELCMTYLKFNLFTIEKGTFNVFRLIMEVFRIIEMLPKEESPAIEVFFEELSTIARNLRLSFEEEDFPIMNRVKYLLVLFTMRKIIGNEKYSTTTEPGDELKIALLDLPLSKMLPEQHAQIVKVFNENRDLGIQNLLKSPETLSFYAETEINSDAGRIEQGSQILETFAIHENMELIEKTFKATIKCVPLYAGNGQLRKKADGILMQMFSHHSLKVRTFVYRESSFAMKKFFACLLNGECAFVGHNNLKFIDEHILGFPLTTELLTEIATSGFEDAALRKNAEDLTYLPIKGRPMLGAEGWTKILDIFLPNIPLYQCLTESPKIIDGILKILDPDAKCLPQLEIIQGNLRFLFHPDASIRSEALARTIYILTSQSNAGRMLPNLMEISDIIPNDCCLLHVPRDIERIFCGGFYESSIVANLMQLLMAPDVEPQVRKTVLMQLNVVGQEETLNRLIFEAGGWMTCLQSLQGALYKQSHTDYPDSVVPIVGILSKLLFCDGQFRQELSKEENVFILLTRSLFLYVNDITVRQDVSLCLFLLLFSSVIVGTKNLTVPKILLNLRLPVKCQPQINSTGKKNILEKLYLGEETSTTGNLESIQRFIRMTIADVKFEGGLQKAKLSTEYTPSLTKNDIRLMKSTSMTENIGKFLKYASNATDHEQIVDSITSMRLIQLLCGGNSMNSDLVTKTFRRFILNTSQLVLLEDTVELFSTLVQVNNETIISWLLASLAEEQAPLLRLLSNEIDTPLSLHRKICGLMSEVFQRAPPPAPDHSQNLELVVFDTLMTITEEHFTNRDLDRTRCVLGVMQVISGRRSLQKLLSRKQVYSTCKKLFFFTIALKSFTQTGSDLQKNALLIISSLSAITPDFQLNGSYLKYLSGLGGHNDYQVRTLAWCILARIAKSSDGAEALIKELDFLPGGFRACCLSTLLDVTEVAMVRQLAGLLFADLLNNGTQFDEIHEIVQKHDFYRIALVSLRYFYPRELLLVTDDQREEITTCDIVRAYSKICIQLIELKSSFCAELCKKPIMGKLYQLVKCPPTKDEQQKSFVSMVGEICNLYSRFSRSHLAFLQTTLCRDHDFLSYLCSFLCTSYPQQHLMSMLNLLMVLSKDQTGFQYICESFAGNSEKIVKLVTVSLDTSLSSSLLQPTCLAFITFLLIKCQQRNVEHECFSDTLETTVTEPTQMKYAAQVLFLQLNKLLAHNYPVKLAKFDTHPNALKVLLCEAIAVLLKTSEKARITAKNIKFLDKILMVFNNFLESIQVPCSTFVRRYSETKKLAVIKHLSLLYGIILNWFSVDVLTDDLQVVELTKVLIQTWSWQNHSNDLRILYLKTLAFLSEKSVPVCRQFSVPTSSNANTLLQILLKFLTMETNKVKSLDSNSTTLVKIGLRTIMNCCSCQEGRMALIKLHALDIIDAVHPFNPKSPKSKNDILVAWLAFWELFSRYPEGAATRNIIGLCTVINKCHNPSLRLIGLKILRNMTFLPSNRTNLLASADFLYTVNNIITNSECYSERLVTCTALWRLISGGAKYAATIKNTKITKKLSAILEDLNGGELQHSANRCQAKDLANVIEIILRILNS